MIGVLSTSYGIASDRLLAAMRDRVSVNNVAMRTLQIVYHHVLDIGCFSHTIDHVGKRFKIHKYTYIPHVGQSDRETSLRPGEQMGPRRGSSA